MSENGEDDGAHVQEFSTAEFVERLGLPPGALVTSIGMVWFDLMSGSGNNMVRIRYRAEKRPFPVLVPRPLEDRLRQLAAKWRSQARHPMRRAKPDEVAMLDKHADELMRELIGKPD